MFVNEYYSIDDLPFNKKNKEITLEYLAHQLYRILVKFNDYYEHHKTYDPLTIVDNIAHSYTFDFEDGGRHHDIKSLTWVEECLVKETEMIIRRTIVEDVLSKIEKIEGISIDLKKDLIKLIIDSMGLPENETSFPFMFKE